MGKTSQHKSSDESDDNDTCALNALKDLDGIASDSGLDIAKLNISNHQQSLKNNVRTRKEKTVSASQKSSRSIENQSKSSIAKGNSTYSDVSTPPMDSKSALASPDRTATSKTSRSEETDISYSPDFTEDTGQSQAEMTAWEKWFVMKQKQIRQRSETEKKKKLVEDQKASELKQKKAEESEMRHKLWLERKKLEEMARKEKDNDMKEKDDKESAASEYRFEQWYLKKLQEKKSQLQYSQELQKYEELQKEMRKKKNEKAQMEWMDKAKQRPMTPRVTYAYVGDSVIGFYDSTSHPPPTYINPIPWQP